MRFSPVLLPCLFALLASGLHSATEPKKPNVLLIISDDLNCRLGCYGAAEAKTPHIDRLAARGVRFERAYCNYPVCNVSRTSFLSGRYPEVTGVLNNATNPRTRLGRDFQFLPEYFRGQGYFTAGCGKVAHGAFNEVITWDYYSEPQRGIDGDGEAPARAKKGKQGGKKGAKKRNTDGTPAAGGGAGDPFPWQATANSDAEEPDGQVARRLLKFFGEKRGQPFFIAAGFHKPHVPHTAPQKYFDLHNPAGMPTPPEPPGHEKQIPAIARAPRSEFGLTVDQRRAIIQHYYAATSFMDAQVGLLLDELDRQKLWDSTIVIFMSDHGWHLGEHGGFYAKMSLMDESARAPFIVAAPGVAPSVSGAIVEYVDLFPTLTGLARLPAPAGLQGTSLAPLLKGTGRRARDHAYTIVVRGGDRIGRALHAPEYTYIEWPDGSQQLYDAVRDRHEYRNLAGQPEHAATLATLKAALAQRHAEITR
jgi:uncharacterized sulfatase